MGLYHDQAGMLMMLFEADEPISANVFVQKRGIGLKTIKKEMETISEDCEENGCVVRSKTGDGYFLEVNDEEKYELYKEEVRKKYYGNLFYKNERSERMHLIIRLFLVHGNMFMNDLAYRCLCSESTLNREMKRVRKRLSEYKLSIGNHTNKGMSLQGDEWHIRLALIEEYDMYNVFEPVAHFDEEKELFEMFMHQGIYHNLLVERILKVLEKYEYALPYYAYDRLAQMIILTMTRRRYASGLKDMKKYFDKRDTEYEEQIIKEIFRDLPGLMDMELDPIELKALALYLELHHTVKYTALKQKKEFPEIDGMVDRFFNELSKRFDLEGCNTFIFRKDLSCELFRLKKQLSYDVHLPRYFGKNFTRDGVLALDLSTLVYHYLLKDSSLSFNRDDILSFYFIASSFTRNASWEKKKRVFVISGQGFFASRSMSDNLRNRSKDESFEYVPVEYNELVNSNMSQVDAILTDIPSLFNEFYYKPVYDLFYVRRGFQIDKMEEYVSAKKYPFFEQNFRKQDVSYPEGIGDISDIENHIVNSFLDEMDDKEVFRKHLREHHELFHPRRNNQIVLMNTIGDFLGRDIFKVLILKEAVTIENDLVNKVVFFNIHKPNIPQVSYIAKHIANLIHTDRLELTYEREKDYEQIRSILMSDS